MASSSDPPRRDLLEHPPRQGAQYMDHKASELPTLLQDTPTIDHAPHTLQSNQPQTAEPTDRPDQHRIDPSDHMKGRHADEGPAQLRETSGRDGQAAFHTET
jgi:hypothetical protein